MKMSNHAISESIRPLLLVKFIKHNQNYYIKLDVLTAVRGLHQKKLDTASARRVKNRKN